MHVVWIFLSLFLQGILVSSRSDDDDSYRLKTDFLPSDYDLTLLTYPNDVKNNPWFDGIIVISLTAAERPSRVIQLHAEDLDISDNDVSVWNGSQELPKTISMTDENDDRNFLTITLFQDVPQFTDIKLRIIYRGYHRDDMYGFYRSSYKNSHGVERYLMATMFEPVASRRAFPCFDEPGIKATVSLTIECDEGYWAISNMPVQSKVRKGGRNVFEFQKTPVMNNYLLAFLVSDFKSIRSKQSEKYQLWARENAIEYGHYASDMSYLAVQTMNKWTNLPYPLPKMDVIAVPDFSAGAMENWGFVTYRERLLLIVDGVSSSFSKQNVIHILCHEVAHQWFGNLVSPQWWKYIWLNEGFATFFGMYISSMIEPKMRIMDQFVLEKHQRALIVDAAATTHPINAVVGSPSEINAIFDEISYSKAGAVIRMMKHLMGPSVFQKGLQNYLKKLQYKTTMADYLYESFQIALDNQKVSTFAKPVKEVWDTWSSQKGFPIIKIVRNYGSNTAIVTQKRFQYIESDDTDDPIWFIPMTYINNQGNEMIQWILDIESRITLNSITKDDPLIINVESTGFYRTNYDDQNWMLIASSLKLKFSNITPLSRAAILDDAFNLARANQLKYSMVFTLLEYLPQEDDFIPWKTALGGLAYLHPRFDTPNGNAMNKLILSYVLDIYNNLKFNNNIDPNEDHARLLLRGTIFSWACKVGLQHCTTTAQNLMTEMMSGTHIHPDIQGIVYCYGLKDGRAETWNFLWEKYLQTGISSEQVLILGALGCTSNVDLMRAFLYESVSPTSTIRAQDANLAINSIAFNPDGGVDIALDFMVHNYPALETRFGKLGASKTVTMMADRITTNDQRNILNRFLEANRDLAIYNAAKETMQTNYEWYESHKDEIEQIIY